ncbi:MAG: cobalamin-dependent protein [Rubrivivax sp.]|jgi:methanogenic corrinoid protein MtbC1|nr:cobalamin-dependent protein [Rubrivivax sp.]
MDRLGELPVVLDAGSAAGGVGSLDGGFATDPTPHERIARIVRTIEADIIPRLMRLHRVVPPEARSAPPRAEPDEADVQEFVRLVLHGSDHAVDDMVRRLRERGATVESIYVDLLTPCARELGRMWSDDECLFSDVTVAVGRLQCVMRDMSPLFAREREVVPDGRRVLLVPAPGEQHTFGLTMVAEFMRRDGWEVLGGYGDPGFDALALLRREWVDVIGISCSCDSRLPEVRRQVESLRRASRNRGVGVMVGGRLFADSPDRAREIGADAAAGDGRVVAEVAERLLGTRALRV